MNQPSLSMLSLVACLFARLETLYRIFSQVFISTIGFNLVRIAQAWYFSISFSGVFGRHFPKTNPLNLESIIEKEEITKDEAAAVVDESSNP